MLILTNEIIEKLVHETDVLYRKNGLEAKQINELQKTYNSLYKDIYMFLTDIIKRYNIETYAQLKQALQLNDLSRLNEYIEETNSKEQGHTVEALIIAYILYRCLKLKKERLNSVYEHLMKVSSQLNTKLSAEFSDDELDTLVKHSWRYGDGDNEITNYKTDINKTNDALIGGVIAVILLNAKTRKPLTDGFDDIVNKALNNEAKIVRTETPRVVNDVLEAFTFETEDKDLITGEYWLIISKIDSKTCSPCLDSNGRYVPVEKAKTGVNIPLFHPHCRCRKIKVIKK